MNVLPDVLKPNLKVVFCGMAAGNKSAQRKQYYAGTGNQFWSVLFRIGLTPYQLEPEEFKKVTEFGIGLTDLVKSQFGGNSQVYPLKKDALNLLSKMKKFSPIVLAFNGIETARTFFNFLDQEVKGKPKQINYGIQTARIGQTTIFVLPSTSPRAELYWDETFWKELANYLNK